MNSIHLVLPIASALVVCGLAVGCNREIPVDDAVLASVTVGESEGVTTTTQETTTVATTTPPPVESTTTEESTSTTEPTVLGFPIEEVESVAYGLYDLACKEYRDVLIDGTLGFDLYESVTDQNGRRYYLVTNSDYQDLDSVLGEWHTVFTDDLDGLVGESYVTVDGVLYGYTAILQKDSSYQDTVLTYYYQDGEDLTFKASCEYSSGTKTFEFCIRYLPDDGTWRVSKFTMPY